MDDEIRAVLDSNVVVHITIPIPLGLFPLDDEGVEHFAEIAAQSFREQLQTSEQERAGRYKPWYGDR